MSKRAKGLGLPNYELHVPSQELTQNRHFGEVHRHKLHRDIIYPETRAAQHVSGLSYSQRMQSPIAIAVGIASGLVPCQRKGHPFAQQMIGREVVSPNRVVEGWKTQIAAPLGGENSVYFIQQDLRLGYMFNQTGTEHKIKAIAFKWDGQRIGQHEAVLALSGRRRDIHINREDSAALFGKSPAISSSATALVDHLLAVEDNAFGPQGP